MTVTVIGNVLHFRGYVVGRLSTDVPATVRADLEDALENAVVSGDEDNSAAEDACKAGYERGLDNMVEQADEASEAGFVEVKELRQIASVLKGNFEP